MILMFPYFKFDYLEDFGVMNSRGVFSSVDWILLKVGDNFSLFFGALLFDNTFSWKKWDFLLETCRFEPSKVINWEFFYFELLCKRNFWFIDSRVLFSESNYFIINRLKIGIFLKRLFSDFQKKDRFLTGVENM